MKAAKMKLKTVAARIIGVINVLIYYLIYYVVISDLDAKLLQLVCADFASYD
jgi:hypothetical protein